MPGHTYLRQCTWKLHYSHTCWLCSDYKSLVLIVIFNLPPAFAGEKAVGSHGEMCQPSVPLPGLRFFERDLHTLQQVCFAKVMLSEVAHMGCAGSSCVESGRCLPAAVAA